MKITSRQVVIIGMVVGGFNGFVLGNWGIAMSQLVVTYIYASYLEKQEMDEAMRIAFPYAVEVLRMRQELPWQKNNHRRGT